MSLPRLLPLPRSMPADYRISITNAAGADSYPISSFTWLLIPTHSTDAAKTKALVGFLGWMLDHGEAEAASLYLRSAAEAGAGHGSQEHREHQVIHRPHGRIALSTPCGDFFLQAQSSSLQSTYKSN